MKRFRYIFAVILSLTIIYVGAGVSIIAALHAKPHKTVAVMVVPNAVSLINSQINHVKKRDAQPRSIR